jgi:hypothetical protein
MLRAVVAAAVLLASASAASAETYACHSVSGEPPVTLDFRIRHSSGAWAVMSAAFQIEDDIGYSTDATEPTSLATVTKVEITSAADVAFKLHYTADDYDGDVASLHVVTLTEGAHSLTAGVLQVTGGGLWAMECDLDYEG